MNAINYCLRHLIIMWILSCSVISFTALKAYTPMDSAEHIGNNWYWSSWFGYFKDLGSGNIYHNEHGQLYFLPEWDSVQGYWLYSTSLDWVYTSPLDYPCFWGSTSSPLYPEAYYGIGTAPYRYFHVVNQHIPATLQDHPDGPHGPVPFWWIQNGLINLGARVENSAPVTVGQLKHVATQAKLYLDNALGLAPSDWNTAFAPHGNPFPFSTVSSDENWKPAGIGQAKFLAAGMYKIIHDHMPYDLAAHYLRTGVGWNVAGLSQTFPWKVNSSAVGAHPLTQGELKMLFGFDLNQPAIGPGPEDSSADAFAAYIKAFGDLLEWDYVASFDAQNWQVNTDVESAMALGNGQPGSSGLMYLVLPDKGPYVVTQSGTSVEGQSIQKIDLN